MKGCGLRCAVAMAAVRGCTLLLLMAAGLLCTGPVEAHPNHQSVRDLPFVPVPLQVMAMRGRVVFDGDSKIVATDESLLGVAELIDEEFHLLTGMRLPITQTDARPGDIVLRLDDRFTTAESYAIVVADRVNIVAGNVDAVTIASATFLQAVDVHQQEQVVSVLKMRISDEPHHAFRSLRVRTDDAATVQRAITLCRWYKLNVLQVVLDDAVMRAITGEDEADRESHLTWQELSTYAATRAVMLTPVIDPSTILDESTVARLTQVFTSPYVVLTGNAEDNAAATRVCDAFQAGGRTVLLDDTLATTMDALPPNAVIVATQPGARWLEAERRIVNATTIPLCVTGELADGGETIYLWDPWQWITRDAAGPSQQHRIDDTPAMIGAQLDATALDDDLSAAYRPAAGLAERIWTPWLRRDFDDFTNRAPHTSEMLKRLLTFGSPASNPINVP